MPKGFPGSHSPDTHVRIDREVKKKAEQLSIDISSDVRKQIPTKEVIDEILKSDKVAAMAREHFRRKYL